MGVLAVRVGLAVKRGECRATLASLKRQKITFPPSIEFMLEPVHMSKRAIAASEARELRSRRAAARTARSFEPVSKRENNKVPDPYVSRSGCVGARNDELAYLAQQLPLTIAEE